MTRPSNSSGSHSVGRSTPRPVFCAALTAPIRRYSPDETIPGLECRYGSRAYSYTDLPPGEPRVCQPARRHGCHNPIESPDQRHHCDACDEDYCACHAAPKDHDCAFVIPFR